MKYSFYEPSVDSFPAVNTKDVKENANEQKSRPHGNEHKLDKTPRDSREIKENTDVQELSCDENAHRFDEVQNENKQEDTSGKRVHQFYEPSEAPYHNFFLLNNLPMDAGKDVIANCDQDPSLNKKVHEVYQPPEEPDGDFSLLDSFLVENTDDAKANANEQEFLPNKNVHQFYQTGETRDHTSLNVTAVTNTPTLFAIPVVEKNNTNEHLSSSNKDIHQCLDGMLDNMDDLCQPLNTPESNISLDGATITISSGKCSFYQQNGVIQEKPEYDQDYFEEQESSQIKNLHQFYQPSKDLENPISLPNVKDYTTRSARKAHLTSLNLGTMEKMAFLKSYHESKRAEVPLLEKYGLRS
eukprot:CAMPEP_0172558924 /NCGR_PEP_ID=MMETSP1067-20121228/81626_1 /TAXON_ID=265564 ORGANISM="Thalassiosira punctigera, Strain Tpunct2005C2" /NCGR_SAMPLE_ID=MMETSP1067 /ASSEMBLY_ACC=CAM_ASM_000444 /LENGTH=354 /DNA_ID=CAMNT_0013348393 /DNA_START=199 /DNA_END=1263 /DNA_ORIENTATION=-